MTTLDRLQNHSAEIPAKLSGLSEQELIQHPPGKWSRKEILGHLTDSAINNLKRFTEASFASEPYLVCGYNQDALVVANRYQMLPLSHLITLWSSLNQQIYYVANALTPEQLAQPIQFENADKPVQTLHWLIDDYVLHLEHHLKTLL
ncbi:DinB family protein [Spirosoma sp. SC4-14]|uniref:DinB family protein n=1 Tax=Spirosoma sp. SC4-14 TaxID=3128900 RepID=UPI0030D2B942